MKPDNFWHAGYSATMKSINEMVNQLTDTGISEHLKQEDLVDDSLYQLLASQYVAG